MRARSVTSSSSLPHGPCSPSGSSVHGIFQARILEWVAVYFSRRIFLTQGLNLHLWCLLRWQAGFSPDEPLGKPEFPGSQSKMGNKNQSCILHGIQTKRCQFLMRGRESSGLSMVKNFDFTVHHWALTCFVLTKAGLRMFAPLCKTNSQPFSGHCDGINYIWWLLIKYLVMLWHQSQIVLRKHYDLSVINVICIICEWSDTWSKSRLLTSMPVLGEIATWSVSTQTHEEKRFDNGLINWISGSGEWAVRIDPIK